MKQIDVVKIGVEISDFEHGFVFEIFPFPGFGGHDLPFGEGFILFFVFQFQTLSF